jgi:hypothetical protein
MSAICAPRADLETLKLMNDWNGWVFAFDDRKFSRPLGDPRLFCLGGAGRVGLPQRFIPPYMSGCTDSG